MYYTYTILYNILLLFILHYIILHYIVLHCIELWYIYIGARSASQFHFQPSFIFSFNTIPNADLRGAVSSWKLLYSTPNVNNWYVNNKWYGWDEICIYIYIYIHVYLASTIGPVHCTHKLFHCECTRNTLRWLSSILPRMIKSCEFNCWCWLTERSRRWFPLASTKKQIQHVSSMVIWWVYTYRPHRYLKKKYPNFSGRSNIPFRCRCHIYFTYHSMLTILIYTPYHTISHHFW